MFSSRFFVSFLMLQRWGQYKPVHWKKATSGGPSVKYREHPAVFSEEKRRQAHINTRKKIAGVLEKDFF
jgi:hypothetical protein